MCSQDKLTLDDDDKTMNAEPVAAAAASQSEMDIEEESLQEHPPTQATPATTPSTNRVRVSGGLDETICLRGAAASTPMCGKTMVAFQTLDETIISSAIDELPPIRDESSFDPPPENPSLLPANSCVADSPRPAPLPESSQPARTRTQLETVPEQPSPQPQPSMVPRLLVDEEPPSLLENSDVAPAAPLIK